MTDFRWDDDTETAAKLYADGDLTDQKIADAVGVHRVTLYRWAKTPEFQARVEEHLDAYRKSIRRRGIAVLERRVEHLNDRHERMCRLMAARAADPELAKLPGGDTGLIVRDLKGIGKGEDFQVVETYSFDSALFREFREHEKQIAQELGQWTSKTEVAGPNGAAVMIGLVEVVKPTGIDGP